MPRLLTSATLLAAGAAGSAEAFVVPGVPTAASPALRGGSAAAEAAPHGLPLSSLCVVAGAGAAAVASASRPSRQRRAARATLRAQATIAETAVANGNFKTLVAALQKAGLVETLSGSGAFTVFAPTDAAFEALLAELGVTAEQLLANPDLKSILLYHVASGTAMSSSLKDSQKIGTVQGSQLEVKIGGGKVSVGRATVAAADVACANGVIHVIDKVLLPPKGAAEPAKKMDGPVAIPFLGAPAYRSFLNDVPGDAGFDPAGFCTDMKTFTSMREAEIKHARLAMLAAVGWPLAELDEPSLAQAWGLRNDLASGGLAPSVLNGGLFDDAPVGFFLGCAALLAAIIDLSKFPDTAPGYYGFDPLNLKDVRPPVIGGSISEKRSWMAEAELKNGRLAMIAITAYAAQEFASRVPVVQETPFLF